MWPLVLDLVLRDCASTPTGGRVPRTCDPGFRRHVIELVKAGRPVRVVAAGLDLAEATVYRWCTGGKPRTASARASNQRVSTSDRGRDRGRRGQPADPGAGD